MKTLLNQQVQMLIQRNIIDAATGKVLKSSPFEKNLVLDQGLNAFAQKSGLACVPASGFAYCHVGSGTNANSFASGAVTFTQSGTTVTASAGFFTSAMVGAIFKYGTGSGGAEYYITAFTDTTHVTVDTSATVAVPDVATVWMVQQTALQTESFRTNNYQTSGSSCGTTVSTNQLTFKRTFNFAVQASPYTVNEIGWGPDNSASVLGRFVLGSSDVVPPTSFYQVVMQLQITYSPGTPTAVGNVGTNIDTSGNAMIEAFGVGLVASNGSTSVANSQVLESGPVAIVFNTQTWTQNSAPANSSGPAAPASHYYRNLSPSWTYVTSSVGIMQLDFSGDSFTTAGEDLYGFALTQGFNTNANMCFSIKLTSTFTLPVGAFAWSATFQVIYSRTLTN